MIALACDEVVMGHHSELGPIDPQLAIPTPEGIRQGPAHGILRDFRRAQAETAFGAEEAYDRFRTHGRPIRLPTLRDVGVRVRHLGDDDALQDAVLSVFHATAITFNGAATKLIENHLGSTWAKVQMPVLVGAQLQPPGGLG
jgi:Serine dehydrogenase proteinase